MRERRAVNLRFPVEVIEGLGWDLFSVIADQVTLIAEYSGWPDAETASERLEWRYTSPYLASAYGMIMSTFEVLPR